MKITDTIKNLTLVGLSAFILLGGSSTVFAGGDVVAAPEQSITETKVQDVPAVLQQKATEEANQAKQEAQEATSKADQTLDEASQVATRNSILSWLALAISLLALILAALAYAKAKNVEPRRYA